MQSRSAGAQTPTRMGGPTMATEKLLADVLAVILRVDSVPVDSHFFDDLGADSLVMAQFCARVRKRSGLPSVSMKDVYQHPTIASLSAALAPAAPVGPHTNQVGGQLAEMLAAVLKVETVSVDSHFFDDLGADSLVMAQFCARVRKHPELPSVTMKDVYQHPTIAALTAALAPAVTAQPEPSVPPPVEVAAPARRLPIALCGLLQLLIFLAYSYFAAFVAAMAFGWISAASGLIDTYLRSALVGGALFVGACLLPVLAKWVLIGRWKPHQEIRIWSLKYVRFWTVKTLIRANPIALFAGSPLYALYLRLLGAKIGRGAVIMSKSVPVCTDLLTIGSGTVIRKQSFFQGYRAHAGRIQTGSVTIGSDVFIGDKTVLDINTGMGDGAQLGHTSSLHSGAWVPAGEHWHGSPAQRTDVDYARVPGLRCGTFRRISAAILSLLGVFFIVMPLIQGGMEMVLSAVPSIAELVQPGQDVIGTPKFFLDAAVISLALFVGGVVVGWLFVMTVPRALNLFITPEKVYPLYGLHYSLSHAITRMTNVKFFTQLFGNSSYSVYYLRRLGYKLFRIKQTGSNFGDEVAHDNPYLCSVGRGTVVADGLALLNAEYSSTSIRLSRVAVGHRNFLGNNIAYPPQGRTGDNYLLATKGHDSPRRTDSRRGGSAGVAALRDPSVGRAGQSVQPAADPRGPATRCRREEALQPAHDGRVPVRAVVAPFPGDPPRDDRSRPVRGAGSRLVGAYFRPQRPAQCVVLRSGRALLHGIPAAEASAVLVLRAILLVARAPMEGACRHVPQLLQRDSLQERDLAPAGCPTRPRGLR